MEIIARPIALVEIKKLAQGRFGDMVKAVVDVEGRIMAIDGELHADEEALLLEQGSRQRDLWGINLYPDLPEADFIEFDSMINVRPSQQNMSRGVEDEKIREKIRKIVADLIRL